MNALALYLMGVLSVIAPHVDEARRTSIANDIATVTLSEERAFKDDANGQKTALLLTSIADHETGRSWAAWIDDGSCNRSGWRAAHQKLMKKWDCDGGQAFSMWQLHVAPTHGRTMAVNRQEAIRTALQYIRASFKLNGTLCAYTGERRPHCRLAEHRLEAARKWYAEFPFEPETVEVASAP